MFAKQNLRLTVYLTVRWHNDLHYNGSLRLWQVSASIMSVFKYLKGTGSTFKHVQYSKHKLASRTAAWCTTRTKWIQTAILCYKCYEDILQNLLVYLQNDALQRRTIVIIVHFESKGGKRRNVCKWLTRCKFASNVVFLCFPLLKKLFRCVPVRKGTILPDLEHIYTVRFGHTWLLTASSPQLGWRLHEGDHFHPQENIDKMAKGEPLTDQVCVSVSTRTIIFCHVNYCLDATDRTQQVRLHWSRW